MTEKEKIQRQMLYDANYNETLLEERAKAKDLCYKFNQTCPSDVEKQTMIMKNCLERHLKISVLSLLSGVITDIT